MEKRYGAVDRSGVSAAGKKRKQKQEKPGRGKTIAAVVLAILTVCAGLMCGIFLARLAILPGNLKVAALAVLAVAGIGIVREKTVVSRGGAVRRLSGTLRNRFLLSLSHEYGGKGDCPSGDAGNRRDLCLRASG